MNKFATFEKVKGSGSPGLSLTVLYHVEVLYTTHFGRRDLNKSDSPDDNTIYNFASVIKLFASNAVANLIHEAILNWNLSIQHYLPEIAKREDKPGQKCSLIDFLSNRLGITKANGL